MASGHPLVGQRIGRYRILAQIGAGGMGEVYRARDEQLERDVALKLLPPHSFRDPDARARLLREARTASQLNHPNICTVHEVGEERDQAYIVMELVDGEPLSARLAASGPLPAAEVVRLGLQMAEALAHAHDRAIIHRDFKSANVVVTHDGRAKVLDFGLAKRLAGETAGAVTRTVSLTGSGALVGTVAYMAPEQLRGRAADTRSDAWSLGVVLYELATGRPPFQGTTSFEASSAILNRPPPPLPASLPPELRAVIERCLEKQPERRYQRAGEVRAALEAIQSGTAPAIPWRYRRTRHWWPAVAAALVVLLAALVAFDVGGLRSRQTAPPSAPRISSLAVLPLENLSGDPAQEYFADGMTDELITHLAGLGGLRVIARGSVMRYKGTRTPLPDVARELNVQALITGTVLRSGDRVRLTAELVDPATEQQLWTRRYERDLKDVLVLQSELTRAIAAEIRLTLSPQDEAITAARPVHPEAFESFLHARYRGRRLTAADQDQAEQYLRRALELDPGFAAAHAALAMIWVSRAHMGVRPPREAIEPARAALARALELDENDAEAHHSLGSLQVYIEWDWAGAERHFLRAIELNPGYAESHLWYSDVLAITGRTDDALARIRRSLDLDPLNLFILTSAAGRLLRLGDRDEARMLLDRSFAGDPNLSLTRRYRWYLFHLENRQDDAVQEAAAFFRLAGRSAVAETIERAHAAAGYAAAMRAGADAMAELYREGYVQPTQIAILYASGGEKGQALAWLETAHDDRDTWLGFLRDEPMLQSLRGEARFQELLRRMNIPAHGAVPRP